MSTDEVRQEALDRVFQEHPEWLGRSDSETLARVQELVDRYVDEISLNLEITEAARRKFAEQARIEGEAARRLRAEEARVRAEREAIARREAAAQEKLRREQRLQEMAPLPRWLTTHKPFAALIAVILLGAVVTGGVWGANTIAASRQAAEAAAQAERQRQAQETQAEAERQAEEAQAEAERQAEEAQAEADLAAEQAEEARIAELLSSCDPTSLGEIPKEVWIAWLECPDQAVVEAAVVKLPPFDLSAQAIERLAKETQDPEVLRRLSLSDNTTLKVHESLVQAWRAEIVENSYRIVYSQDCSSGVDPDTYLAGTSWQGKYYGWDYENFKNFFHNLELNPSCKVSCNREWCDGASWYQDGTCIAIDGGVSASGACVGEAVYQLQSGNLKRTAVGYFTKEYRDFEDAPPKRLLRLE